jgi:hypothetical protein
MKKTVLSVICVGFLFTHPIFADDDNETTTKEVITTTETTTTTTTEAAPGTVKLAPGEHVVYDPREDHSQESVSELNADIDKLELENKILKQENQSLKKIILQYQGNPQSAGQPVITAPIPR